MTYLPDTNVWIRFLNPGANRVKQRLLSCTGNSLRLCAVVKAELYYGAMKSRRTTENLKLLDELFANFQSYAFDDDAALRYGRLRASLSRQGTPIGPNDLMIAAIAVTHNLTLVTSNTREFSRIPDLQLEDWEASASG